MTAPQPPHVLRSSVRGPLTAKRPSAQTLTAFAPVRACALARLGFAAGANLDRLLAGTDFAAMTGQSTFAVSRGNTFQNILRQDNHAAFVALVATFLRIPPAAARVLDLHGRGEMPDRHALTREAMEQVLRDEPDAPNLIDSPVFAALIDGETAYFEADALVCRRRRSIVCEVKSFPKTDDRAEGDGLGRALDQAGLYVVLLRRLLVELGGAALDTPDSALIVLPEGASMRPTLTHQRDIASHVRRMAALLASLPGIAAASADVPAGMNFAEIAGTAGESPERRLQSLQMLADAVGTTYRQECVASCGLARFCRSRAFAAGSTCVMGSKVSRSVPGIATAGRVVDLAAGAAPTEAEEEIAEQLRAADEMFRETL